MTDYPIKLRWSGISTFMGCQRAYDLSYREGLVRNGGSDSRSRILGSHVHAGIHAALNYYFNTERELHPATFQRELPRIMERLVGKAVQAVRDYNNEITEKGRTVVLYPNGSIEPDVEYYGMMSAIVVQAVSIVRYQLPVLGLGRQYRVASIGEVLGQSGSIYNVPMTEWNFHLFAHRDDSDGSYALLRDYEEGDSDFYDGDMHVEPSFDLTGTADAVLQDLHTGEYILFDWKCRKQMPDNRLVDLDGQLRYYAAVINYISGHPIINRTCQYQMSQSVPRPAEFTEKTKRVSMAAIISTWEVWSQSLRDIGIDPEPFRERMEPKLRTEEDFRRPVFTPVTPISSARILNIVLNIGQKIEQSERDDSFPPMPSLYGCEFCDFKAICSADLNGGDPFYVRETEYHHEEPTGDD